LDKKKLAGIGSGFAHSFLWIFMGLSTEAAIAAGFGLVLPANAVADSVHAGSDWQSSTFNWLHRRHGFAKKRAWPGRFFCVAARFGLTAGR
jgi:hypothetical protein